MAKEKEADMDVRVKDYQPSEKEFAGAMMGKTNDYIPRKEKQMNREASQVRKQAYKGRYD